MILISSNDIVKIAKTFAGFPQAIYKSEPGTYFYYQKVDESNE